MYSLRVNILLACFVHIVDAAKNFGSPIFIGLVVSYGGTLLLLCVVYALLVKPYFQKRLRPSYVTSSPDKSEERPDRVWYSSDNPVPKYWKNRKGYPKWIDITESKDAEMIKRVVYSLWKEEEIGKGRDASRTQNKCIKIRRIQRMENGSLFEQYDSHRKRMERKEDLIGTFPDPPQLSSQIETTELIGKIAKDSILEQEVYHNLHEHYLFHGTSHKNLTSICDGGLKISKADGGLFGKGIYLADNPTKSDQYAGNEDQNRTQLLVRVCLGELYIQKTADRHASQFTSPPCRTCYNQNCQKHPYTFDSAVADIPNFRFREYMVYKNGRSYPEYIITYDRVEVGKESKEMERYRDLNE